ncbi:MAG: alpha/beta fold hydrolase [Bdellovibrionales bacterium]|nr:alpha/beta fold hydrolase [Bdellovibrionales bacterium]
MPVLKRPDVSIHYELKGDQGDPIIFIQGIGVAGSGWEPQVEEFSRDHQTVTFDNRGLGKSTPYQGAISIERMADDVAALMDELKWESAHIVGHSMGGVIAQDLAIRHRKRVRSLTLMCTFARGKDGARPTPWVIWMSLRTRLGPRSWRRRAFLEMLFPPAHLRMANLEKASQEIGRLVGRDLADSPPILMKQLKALGRHDISPRLPELARLPTLVLSGKFDPIAKSQYGRMIADGIPGAVFEEYENAAHALPIQLPVEVNRRLREFLSAIPKK